MDLLANECWSLYFQRMGADYVLPLARLLGLAKCDGGTRAKHQARLHLSPNLATLKMTLWPAPDVDQLFLAKNQSR